MLATKRLPLLVSRSLADDSRCVTSCPVTFPVATRGPPLKSSYLLAKIATLISSKSNLLTIERPAAAAQDAEFPWATESVHGNSGTHELIRKSELRNSRTPELRNSKIRKLWNSRTQERRNARTQALNTSRAQERKNSGNQKLANS